MANYNQYIEALKQKDADAFDYIYNETKHAVYAMIVSIVKDRFACEDIMQDTYITMLEKIDQYQKGKNFLSWLIVIARNKAIDYYRRHKKEVFIDKIDEEMIFPSVAATGERSAMMNEVINCLNETQRSIFFLHIIENIKFREIAKILNMPLGTVLWHFNKAIKIIKKLDGGEGCEVKR